jgi:hypothetical protein
MTILWGSWQTAFGYGENTKGKKSQALGMTREMVTMP